MLHQHDANRPRKRQRPLAIMRNGEAVIDEMRSDIDPAPSVRWFASCLAYGDRCMMDTARGLCRKTRRPRFGGRCRNTRGPRRTRSCRNAHICQIYRRRIADSHGPMRCVPRHRRTTSRDVRARCDAVRWHLGGGADSPTLGCGERPSSLHTMRSRPVPRLATLPVVRRDRCGHPWRAHNHIACQWPDIVSSPTTREPCTAAVRECPTAGHRRPDIGQAGHSGSDPLEAGAGDSDGAGTSTLLVEGAGRPWCRLAFRSDHGCSLSSHARHRVPAPATPRQDLTSV